MPIRWDETGNEKRWHRGVGRLRYCAITGNWIFRLKYNKTTRTVRFMKTAIVVAFERFPLRMLGCYGRSPSPSLHLDRFAADGVVFDWHFAENTDANAANHAWWAGRFQFPISVDSQKTEPKRLLDSLHAADVELVSLFDRSSRWNTATHGSWETQIDLPISPGATELFGEASRILERWSTAPSKQRLLWIGPSVFSSSAESNHGIEETDIRAIDESIGRFLDELRRYQESAGHELLTVITAAEGMSETVVSATSDMADPADDDNRIAETVVHSPLIVRVGTGQAGLRQSCLVQTVDLAPTLHDWFGLIPDSGFEGRSFLPRLQHAATESGREFLCFGHGMDSCGIRTRDFCLLTRFPEREQEAFDDHRLFSKPDDVWEVHDVAGQEPETVSVMSSQLRGFLSQRP